MTAGPASSGRVRLVISDLRPDYVSLVDALGGKVIPLRSVGSVDPFAEWASDRSKETDRMLGPYLRRQSASVVPVAGSGTVMMSVPLEGNVTGVWMSCAPKLSARAATGIDDPASFVLGRPGQGKGYLYRRMTTSAPVKPADVKRLPLWPVSRNQQTADRRQSAVGPFLRRSASSEMR